MGKRDLLPIDVALEPFSQTNLDKIFQLDPDHSDRIMSRESSWLEFKQNFNWASWEKYARTAAAFANARGGYIVFGIGNKPRKLTGMTNTNFEDTDPETITKDLNSSFAPALEWQSYVYFFQGQRFGMLFFWESSAKPVIATANRQEFKEGDILFRYRGKTERIRHTELHAMIEARQTRNMDSWLRFIQRVARIGVDNAAVLDMLEGTVSGPGGTLVIDEKLLQKIRFIREGRFHERDGAMTLRLVGDVQPLSSNIIQPTRLVDKQVGITTPDIVHAFLQRAPVTSPREFIKQICFEASGYLPIYYFMTLARLAHSDVIKFVQGQNSRNQGQTKLLERLERDKACIPGKIGLTSQAGIRTQNCLQAIKNKEIDRDISPEDLKYALNAIRTLRGDEIDADYLFPILMYWFDTHYSTQPSVTADNIRKTICYVDCILYREGTLNAS